VFRNRSPGLFNLSFDCPRRVFTYGKCEWSHCKLWIKLVAATNTLSTTIILFDLPCFAALLTEIMWFQQRPFNNNQGYLPNGATGGPPVGATPLLPNSGRIIQTGGVRVLCVADVRGLWDYSGQVALNWLLLGNLRSLNELAKQARADHIIHTGDFGFYDDTSLERIADK